MATRRSDRYMVIYYVPNNVNPSNHDQKISKFPYFSGAVGFARNLMREDLAVKANVWDLERDGSWGRLLITIKQIPATDAMSKPTYTESIEA